MTFTIRVERCGAVAALRLAGELDMATAPELSRCVQDLIASGSPRVLVKLDELTFCDSAGLTVLVQGEKLGAARGGWLRVTGESGHVARVLELSGVLELLAYRPGDDERPQPDRDPEP